MFLYLSIVFFGLVAWSIPSIMAAAIGDYVGPKKSAAAIGFVTFIFRLGQMRSNTPDLFRPDRPSRPVGRLRGYFAPRNPFPRLFDASILEPRSA